MKYVYITIAVLVTILAFAVIAHAQEATPVAAPATNVVKITDAEKLAIRDAQVKVLSLAQQLSNVEKQLADANTAFNEAVNGVRVKYKCDQCAFTQTLDLQKAEEKK